MQNSPYTINIGPTVRASHAAFSVADHRFWMLSANFTSLKICAMQLIAQGAEAKVYDTGDTIIKTRLSKAYRIPEIDRKIIRQRIKKEVKVLQRLEQLGVKAPRFIKVEGNSIHMEKIAGIPVRDYLQGGGSDSVLRGVGVLVAELHGADVVHGDLTTLNFMINDTGVYAIDFGLSSTSAKDEDKAVDLYVFERALGCGHPGVTADKFYEGYGEKGAESVLQRLESVRKRGRKREEAG